MDRTPRVQKQILQRLARAPAKVNLHLRVLGRRSDGYHILHSFMAPVSLYDELYITIRPGSASPSGAAEIAVTTTDEAASGGPVNLAHRATSLFLEALRQPAMVDIHIAKHIPVGSGLGGGSSDAAAVLLTLNSWLDCPLSVQELCKLGAQVGADVPFFIYGTPAVVAGVGDRISPTPLSTTLNLVVCWDRFPLSTREVYSRVDLPSLTSAASVSNIATFVGGRQPISELLVNDLEGPASQLHPEVLALKAKLVRQGALGALMTGSGSAVFAIWADGESAQRAAVELRHEGLWAQAVHTLDVSPAAEC